MADIYRHLYSLFNQEKAKLDQGFTKRQDDSPGLVLQIPIVVGAALLGLGVSSFLLGLQQPRQKLEDHPMCGITTGGQAECYFDCQIFSSASTSSQVVTNLECLKDCFRNQTGRQRQQAVHCVHSLISDVLQKGVCAFPEPPEYIDYEYYDFGSGDFPRQSEEIYPTNPGCIWDDSDFLPTIIEGTCSPATEELLLSRDCLYDVFEQLGFISGTITQIIQKKL